VTLLQSVRSPQDLKRLDMAALTRLAGEIRGFLVEKVSRTGGHLGPNLGAVELTLAIHRVFDSPHDPVIFDTGHQAYVHKIVTGRAEGFDRLRKRGGLSGYPSRAASTTGWSPVTPPRRCPAQTGWPRPSLTPAPSSVTTLPGAGTSSWWSVTVH